ncbi:MAG: hypothetical protein IK088_09540 [Lachnospiraceae bacterium]|nr:hypothetical protein [Lachnospiraceae bacterium]
MKKFTLFAIAAVLMLSVITSSACFGGNSGTDRTGSDKSSTSNATEDTEKESASQSDTSKINWDTLTWHTADVDTLGSGSVSVSFAFPEDFGGYQSSEADMSFITYGSSTRYGEKEGLYSITAQYFRGDSGPGEEEIRSLEGTCYEVEINGKTVLVSKYANEGLNKYVFTYFASFNDSVNSRVVFSLTDTEPFGGFRAMFERKLWWV